MYHSNKNQRSELDHLLRVVKPSKGDRQHKEEKRIYFTSTLIKASLALIFVVCMNISTIPIFKVISSDQFESLSTKCLFDPVHERWMKASHDYLEAHPKFLDFVIIASSISIDAIMIFILMCFILYARSPRVFYAIAIFYIVRAICQANFLFEYPKGLIFRDPGFFSIAVPYGATSDFYFSGHSGFLVLATMELIQMKMVLLAFINFVSTFYTAWMLLATQGHYSIGKSRVTADILMGWLFALWSYRIAFVYKNDITKFLRKFLCLPFWKSKGLL